MARVVVVLGHTNQAAFTIIEVSVGDALEKVLPAVVHLVLDDLGGIVVIDGFVHPFHGEGVVGVHTTRHWVRLARNAARTHRRFGFAPEKKSEYGEEYEFFHQRIFCLPPICSAQFIDLLF